MVWTILDLIEAGPPFAANSKACVVIDSAGEPTLSISIYDLANQRYIGREGRTSQPFYFDASRIQLSDGRAGYELGPEVTRYLREDAQFVVATRSGFSGSVLSRVRTYRPPHSRVGVAVEQQASSGDPPQRDVPNPWSDRQGNPISHEIKESGSTDSGHTRGDGQSLPDSAGDISADGGNKNIGSHKGRSLWRQLIFLIPLLAGAAFAIWLLGTSQQQELHSPASPQASPNAPQATRERSAAEPRPSTTYVLTDAQLQCVSLVHYPWWDNLNCPHCARGNPTISPEAESVCAEAIQDGGPQIADFWFRLGYVQFHLRHGRADGADTARDTLRKSAALGSVQAAYLLAFSYSNGRDPGQDLDQAKSLFRKAKGITMAMVGLAGLLVDDSPDEARKLAEAVYRDPTDPPGKANAARILGDLHFNGSINGTQSSQARRTTACELYREGAKGEDTTSRERLEQRCSG